jgi:hypothetical protein
MSFNLAKKYIKHLPVWAMYSISAVAMAAPHDTDIIAKEDLAGAGTGLGDASTSIQSFQGWLLPLVGITSVIYLLYLGILAKTGKKTWSDFGMGVVHVAVLGSIPVLGSWAWNLMVGA